MLSNVSDVETKRLEVKEQYKKFISRKIVFIFISIGLIIVIASIAATLGTYPITVREVYATIWRGFFTTSATLTITEIVVWNLRLPVILMGIIAGTGLAIAGTVMQGVLRNPLASPFTLGISAAAGFGAALAIIFGAGFFGGKWLIISNAFLFSLVPTFVIMGLARYRRATPETMILGGIALFSIFGAATSMIMYFGDKHAVREAYFWMVGSLGRASWDNLPPLFIVLPVCTVLLMGKSWDINAMSSGDEAAKSLGVDVEPTRLFVMLVASLLTASIISFVGSIGFIGLVAPHICRMVIGGDNRFLIPASGLCGAVLLLAADTVARTIIAPIILPVGILTAFIGGPIFFHLLMRKKKSYW